MTGLLALPTKTDGSIGRVKNTLPEDVGVEFDLDYYETAAEAERQKDALIAIAARMGLGDGTTPGSFEAMKAGLEAGEGLRLMTLDGSGAYASIRIEDSFAAPTAAHGYSAGYRVGSWWVERGLGEGPGVPGPITLWVCLGDTDEAASWQVVASPADSLPLANGAPAAGTSQLYARADHVHPVDHVHPDALARAIEEGALDFQSRPAATTTGDFASIPGSLVPDAGPWTVAFYYTPTIRFSAGGILAAKWDTTGTRGFVAERYGDGLIVWFSAGSNFAYTLDTLFVAGTEREIAIAFNGAGATSADRIKISSRITGGTWTTHTLTFSGTIPTSIAVTGAPVTFARASGSGSSAVSANFRMRDLRILSTAVTPSSSSDLALTSLSSRYRFRSLIGTTTPDEITGAPMTLTHTLGGSLRPARSVASWQAGTYPLGPILLPIGDSKTSGSSAARGAWRHETCNQLAAVWGRRPTFVGRFADADARAEFAYNSRHSGLGGALLNGTILTRCTDDVVAYAPDLVVLEGGTNDVLGGASATTARDRMSACIDAVLAASATARLIVMSDPAISAITYPAEHATLATYNGLLGALVASKGARVSFVDVFPLTHEDYLWDAAHMLEPGYTRIAELIAAEIARVVNRTWVL